MHIANLERLEINELREHFIIVDSHSYVYKVVFRHLNSPRTHKSIFKNSVLKNVNTFQLIFGINRLFCLKPRTFKFVKMCFSAQNLKRLQIEQSIYCI